MTTICLDKSGTMTLVTGGKPRAGSLPVCKLHSQELAEQVQTLLCATRRDGRHVMPFSGAIEDLERAGQLIAAWARWLEAPHDTPRPRSPGEVFLYA